MKNLLPSPIFRHGFVTFVDDAKYDARAISWLVTILNPENRQSTWFQAAGTPADGKA